MLLRRIWAPTNQTDIERTVPTRRVTQRSPCEIGDWPGAEPPMTPTQASGFFDLFHGVVVPVFRGRDGRQRAHSVRSLAGHAAAPQKPAAGGDRGLIRLAKTIRRGLVK
jgi:hypothetical protein